MTQYHAVMLDETGCEFGHTFNATCREAAWAYVKEEFPESRCVQLEDPDDSRRREAETYRRACLDYGDGMASSFWDMDDEED
jgi:hypothetical protein